MGATLATLLQAVALAYASGISLYATVALIGIAERWGWVPAVPAPLDHLASPWIVGIAFVLTVVEFLATLGIDVSDHQSHRVDAAAVSDADLVLTAEVQHVVHACPRVHKWAIVDRDPLPRWGEGPMVLLGDAGHPMTQYMAQGAASVLALDTARF